MKISALTVLAACVGAKQQASKREGEEVWLTRL